MAERAVFSSSGIVKGHRAQPAHRVAEPEPDLIRSAAAELRRNGKRFLFAAALDGERHALIRKIRRAAQEVLGACHALAVYRNDAVAGLHARLSRRTARAALRSNVRERRHHHAVAPQRYRHRLADRNERVARLCGKSRRRQQQRRGEQGEGFFYLSHRTATLILPMVLFSAPRRSCLPRPVQYVCREGKEPREICPLFPCFAFSCF